MSAPVDIAAIRSDVAYLADGKNADPTGAEAAIDALVEAAPAMADEIERLRAEVARAGRARRDGESHGFDAGWRACRLSTARSPDEHKAAKASYFGKEPG